MRARAALVCALTLAACHGGAAKHPAETDDDEGGGEEVVAVEPAVNAPAAEPAPRVTATGGELAAVPASELCVTHGKLDAGAHGHAKIRDASVRAVAQGSRGDRAEVHFTYRGESAKSSHLASGDMREQIALKLRAADGCNLIYVGWRFAPKTEIVVQTKINPGAHDSKACGTSGYTRIKATKRSKLHAPVPDSEHVLAAALDGTMLEASIDGAVVWRGALPAAVRSLHGPVGVRTDNVAADLDLYAIAGGEESTSKCEPGQGGD